MAIARTLTALALPLLLLGGSGCRSLPAGAGMPPEFAAPFPSELQVLQSVVIRYRGHPFTALGWFRMNREEGRYALTGLTPAGLPLFTLSEAGMAAEGAFAFPVGGQEAAWTQAMAEDVRRIFLDAALRPGDRVTARRGGWRVERALDGQRTAELDYEPDGRRLVQARWFENGRRVGETKYSEHQEVAGVAMPGRVEHHHRRHGYTLEIRVRQVQRAGPGAPP